jgi:hypothetical protein
MQFCEHTHMRQHWAVLLFTDEDQACVPNIAVIHMTLRFHRHALQVIHFIATARPDPIVIALNA